MLDDKLFKEIDKLTLEKEKEIKRQIERTVLLDTFLDEKIRPVLDQYFEKIRKEIGCKVELIHDFDYDILYKDKTFSIIRVMNFPRPEFDFALQYTVVCSGRGLVIYFMMQDYKETLDKFIIGFHKYLLKVG